MTVFVGGLVRLFSRRARTTGLAVLVALAGGTLESRAQQDTVASDALEKFADTILVKPTGEVVFSSERVERIVGPDGEIYVAEGNVRAADETTEVRCDRATFRRERKIVEAEGNVVLTQPNVTFEADRVTYDFVNRTGCIESARAEMPIPAEGAEGEAVYIKAGRLEQTGPDDALVEQVSVTTCDLPDPHYRISAREAEFRYGDRIVLDGAVVFLGSIPIFYWPRFTYVQGETRRRVEFEVGRESHIGEYLRLGFNFTPVPDMDLTLRTDAYTKAGYGFGLDGKVGLFKRDVEVEEGAEQAAPRGQGEFRTYIAKDERGRAEVYYRHEFPDEWVGLMQVEHWSDRDFLKEFYYDEFEERTEPESFLNLTKTWDDAVLSMTARKQVTGFIEDVNRLPETRFTLLDRPLLSDSVRFTLDETAGYLDHRPHGPSAARSYTAARIAFTELSRPGLTVVPYVEGRGRWYSRGPDDRDDQFSGSYEVGMAAGSRLHRTYGSFLKTYTELKHVVMPTVTVGYESTPTENPEEHFWFDPLDDAYRNGRVGIQLDNRLYGRTDEGSLRQLVRWTLYGGTDFTTQQPRSTRDFESWLDVYLTNRVKFTSSAETHRGAMDFDRADVRLEFGQTDDPRGNMFSIGYVYEDIDDVETLNRDIDVEVAARLGEKYRFRVRQRYDFEDSRLERQEYVIERDMHCMVGAIGYRKRRTSSDVFAVLSLKAFPSSRLKF